MHHEAILEEFLAPLHVPRHALIMGGFGVLALNSASGFAKMAFQTEAVGGMFAGLAAHSVMPLEQPATVAFGLMLGMLAHAGA